MSTPEGRTKTRIKKMLKEVNAWFYMPVQGGYGSTTLDFIVSHPLTGKTLLIEAKAHKEAPTDRQQAIITDAEKYNIKCFVCDDEAGDLEPRFESVESIKQYLTSSL